MASHIDVLSYLLGAIVFSVGFLSTRLHATADATRRQASDASWRVRDVLMHGERLAPAELAGVLYAVRSRSDSIARMARVVNLALIGAIGVVFTDGMRLIAVGAAHPSNAALLTSILLIGGVAVGIVGEMDARHLESTLRAELAQTTLGRLERINRALECRSLSDAARELSDLHRTFPMWGLLSELEAYVVLCEGDPERALQRVLVHLQESADIYVSGLVGCAAAIKLEQPDSALRVLEAVEHRVVLSPEERLLRRAVRLQAGHLDEMLNGDVPHLPGRQSAAENAGASRGSAGVSGMVFEGLAAAHEAYALDLDADSVPELRRLLAALRDWNHSFSPESLPSAGAFALVRELVTGSPTDSSELVSSIVEMSTILRDGESVESLGVALLVSGHPRLAVNVFERAIALLPKSARVHWAHGVSCWQWGWSDKAVESIRRAITLDRDDPVLQITRLRVETPGQRRDREPDLARLSNWSLLPSQRLQLALVGLPLSGSMTPTSSRERFTEHLIARALDTAPPLCTVESPS